MDTGLLARHKAGKARGSGSRWERIRQAVLARDHYRCRDCGRAGHLEVDHIQPLHRGGTNDMDNLQTLCADCHTVKTMRDRYGRDLDVPGKRQWVERVTDAVI